VVAGKNGLRNISPTDVAQFIRLEQCQRYLRLRLHERTVNARFMADYGVTPQSIPPLLTESGQKFEHTVEHAVKDNYAVVNLAASAGPGPRDDDNRQVVAGARDLPAGATLILLQPRLHVAVDGWLLRGDVDILRLERDEDGALHALIADMKSSTSAKVEHRLQVAFYHEMLAALFAQKDIPYTNIALAILYRGAVHGDEGLDADELVRREAQAQLAEEYFGTRLGLLEIVDEPEGYIGAVRDLVTDPASTAQRVSGVPFEDIPFHLTYKCDGCLYNEFCMKWSAEHDDLSLLPHITAREKNILRQKKITTARALATLKEPRPTAAAEETPRQGDLIPAPGQEDLVRSLAATQPVGARLDELIHRARRYRRWKGDQIESLSYIPSKGYGSLPYSDAGHNPNLVRVYIDAQHDYLQDRIYMLGALVVAYERGVEVPQRRRSIVHLAAAPPDTAEREQELCVRWTEETIRAIGELAAPADDGTARAPIHLIFYNSFEQRLLLDGLGRHANTILGATPLYDFVTQLAAFDSPVASFLDQEIRELKNYPMVCQSLQAVAAQLRFDWNTPEPYREIFRTRLFDSRGKLDRSQDEDGAEQESFWYTSRARFNSQIPLEYAYAAWKALDRQEPGRRDDYAAYRAATLELLAGFHARRLEALEHIAHDFVGNKQTEKRLFDLPDLATFTERAQTLAQALDEFVTIERHVELGDWKRTRLAPPERRVLSGDTLIVRYCEEDQDPDVVAKNRDNAQRQALKERLYAEYRADNPGATRVQLTKEQRAETTWSPEGLRVRLRLACADIDCAMDTVVALSTLGEGDRVVLNRRTTVDSRLPEAERVPFTPTPRQMLYGGRADIARVVLKEPGTDRPPYVEVELSRPGSYTDGSGFVFASIDQPLVDGTLYTLDADPNDWYDYFLSKVTEGLIAGETNTLYDRLADPSSARVSWPPSARAGQARFLAGLDALHRAGLLDPFEESKRAYIGAHGDDPTLLVQGPPGTGKSYTTAFALFARLQGAMAAGRDYRVFISCKTHAATDVLLEKVAEVQRRLAVVRAAHPLIFADYFDPRLLDLPLYRARPRGNVPDGIIPLPREEHRAPGEQRAIDRIVGPRWCVAGSPPGATRGMLKEKWPKGLFGHDLCDALVLDEASQMNLPEAVMAALPLKGDGHLIVVGDHRQMPPIVKHDWIAEPRRTFQHYRSYESLFLTLLEQGTPLIKFEESFRLHRDMAEFLRREIYCKDGIDYYSRQHQTLRGRPQDATDPFVVAVLEPDHPLVVVVHDEEASQVSNMFEQGLIRPVLEALSDPTTYNLGPEHGLGVVVPHRAQRAALQAAIPLLTTRDPATGAITRSAVDTVEKFQGDERTVIMISATESDHDYLLASSGFLLDPRRLTVALSRAKCKMILVAARSVFSLFSADEETFAHAQLWKDLLRRTCTVKLWAGERDGHHVDVWGNAPAAQRLAQQLVPQASQEDAMAHDVVLQGRS